MERVFGIDVSRWQGDFNWAAAKKEGVQFGIVKCGGADGGLYEDSKFLYNCRESSAVGMKIGAYYFGNAATVAEAKKEAEHCISIIKGHAFSYPIYYDVEAARMNVGKANLDAIIRTWCETVEAAGYFVGFYMNMNWYKNYCNGSELAKRFTTWIASWGASKPTECDMWQFGGETNLLRSNKITGKTVDQNYCYRDFPTEVRAKGLNGFKKTSSAPASKPTANEVVYTVVSGDTLSGIAAKYCTTYQKLAAYNGIANPNLIYVGQKITIPNINV